MLDILYNGIIICMAVLWVSSHAQGLSSRVLRFGRSNIQKMRVLSWVAFIAFLFAYCLFFSQLAGMHDIPNAVDAATDSEADSLNPYNHSVVPRFDGHYSHSVSITFGPYNYLPLDLDIYGLFDALIGSLGMPYWFVAINLVFSAIGFYLLNRLIEVSWISFIPVAGIIALFYSFDNVSLTLLLIIVSIFLYSKDTTRSRFLAIVVMGLAVMTKIQAIIPFGVLIIFEMQRWARARDHRIIVETSAGVAASACIGVVLMAPFGFWNVVKAAVLFHADSITRVGTSTGGTLLTELNLATTEYTIIVLALVAVSLLASLYLPRLSDRMTIVSMVFLLVAIKSSQSLLVVPGLFLVLGVHEAARAKTRTPSEPAEGVSHTAPSISSARG